MAKKILIVQLVANGDCLMVTTLARQLKADYPDCHITWAISYKCSQVLMHNPSVDSIWEINYADNEHPLHDVFPAVKKIAEERKARGDFDEIYYSQLLPDNRHRYDGTTRSSTFRVYPHPFTVPVTPVIILDENEKKRVDAFALKHQFAKYKTIVLCECAPASGQSNMSVVLMLDLTKRLAAVCDDCLFIISSHVAIESGHPRIIDASVLSYRENAHLSYYCHLLIGCSSGITWLLTSDAAQKINTVQFLSKTDTPFQFASVAYDFSYWGLDTNHILESTTTDLSSMEKIVLSAITDFTKARAAYHEPLRPSLRSLRKNCRELFRLYGLKGKEKVRYCRSIFFERNKVGWMGQQNISVYCSLLMFKLTVKKTFYKIFLPNHRKAKKYG